MGGSERPLKVPARWQAQEESEDRAPVPVLVFGALLGGAVGVVGGALIGAGLTPCAPGEEGFCTMPGLLIGPLVGTSICIPVMVHAFNGGRGNFGANVLATGGVGVGLILTAVAVGGEAGFLVTIPLAQMVTSVAVEETTED